jgi:hypothetical protein
VLFTEYSRCDHIKEDQIELTRGTYGGRREKRTECWRRYMSERELLEDQDIRENSITLDL